VSLLNKFFEFSFRRCLLAVGGKSLVDTQEILDAVSVVIMFPVLGVDSSEPEKSRLPSHPNLARNPVGRLDP
jgi:hypothetical protein